MLQPINIINHLRDQEFDEMELLDLLNQLIREQREDAANKTWYRCVKSIANFKAVREQHLSRVFHNEILPELNNERKENKIKRAQEMYKQNRKDKQKGI